MNNRIIKETVAAALLISSIFSFTTITYGKETNIQQSIDAVKLEMKRAPLNYVDSALESVLEPSKDLYPVLNNVKKHYKEVKQQIQSSKLSTKVKKEKIKELDLMYEEKITKGVIPYIDAYNYAVKYLEPILKEMLAAHAAGDLDGVEKAYHKLSYQLDSRTSILYRFTGKAPRDLLLEKYKKPSDVKRDELRIPVTVYMKNNEVLRLWKEGKKEEAKKVMDEVLTLIEKASINGNTNYSSLLSKEVQEAAALFSTNLTPTPQVPSNPSVGNGNNETPSENSTERRLRIAKSNAIAELENYKKSNKDNYSLTNWTTILAFKKTWATTINSAASPTIVTKTLIDAKEAIDQVAVKSNVSTINGISVKGTIAEVDNTNTTTYNLALPAGTILADLKVSDITTTPTNLDAVISTTTPDEGNTWEIEVTSEDGNSTTKYILKIAITPQ